MADDEPPTRVRCEMIALVTYDHRRGDATVPPARAAVARARRGVPPVDLDCAAAPTPSAPAARGRLLTGRTC